MIINRKMSWGISYNNLPYFTIWNNRNGLTKWMFQHHRCCVFDSPGLPNDSVGYPGLVYIVRGTTPSVLRFLSVIRHESHRYTHAFIEKAQHLRRWISMQTFTRGRLVPRQPRAIKRTTRTELRGERICNVERFLWNISATPTALHRYNIRNGGCINGNAGITPTALNNRNIRNNGHIHWNIGTTSTALLNW